MQSYTTTSLGAAILVGLMTTHPVLANPFFFSTGNPDGLMATASRPDTAVAPAPSNEIELADDFILDQSDKDHERHIYGAAADRDAVKRCQSGRRPDLSCFPG